VVTSSVICSTGVTVAATDVSQAKTWICAVRAQIVAPDRAISEAVEQTATPDLDRVLVRLSERAVPA
jgi:hypothetical protein